MQDSAPAFQTVEISPATQTLQQLMTRIAICWPAHGLLGAANSLAGIGANNTVCVTRIVIALAQQHLQFDPLGAAQRSVILWPISQNGPATAEALRQQAHCQCLGRRVVVTQDGAEVIQHQERRPTVARRQQQGGTQLL